MGGSDCPGVSARAISDSAASCSRKGERRVRVGASSSSSKVRGTAGRGGSGRGSKRERVSAVVSGARGGEAPGRGGAGGRGGVARGGGRGGARRGGAEGEGRGGAAGEATSGEGIAGQAPGRTIGSLSSRAGAKGSNRLPSGTSSLVCSSARRRSSSGTLAWPATRTLGADVTTDGSSTAGTETVGS